MSAAHVVIRADGGSRLGIGHLRRCAVLAGTLQKDGYVVEFVRRRDDDDPNPPAVEGFPTRWIAAAETDGVYSQHADAAATIAAVGRASGRRCWAVVDHYQLDSLWEADLRAAGYAVIAIDDFRHRPHASDILVSDCPIPFRHDPLTAQPPRQLVGFAFALIEPAFAFAGPTEPPAAARILVTYGGSDPGGQTLRASAALQRLRRIRDDIGAVDLVIGPANRLRAEIEDGAAQAGFTTHVAPTTLAPLMRSADVVMTAGGNTMAEALSLRKACLVTVTADNQRLIVDALVARDQVVEAAPDMQAMTATLATLLDSRVSRSRWLQTTPCVDHLGAQRIAGVMRELEAS